MKGQNGVRKPQRIVWTLSLFETELGWMGLVGRNGEVECLRFGSRSDSGIRRAVGPILRSLDNTDWSPSVRTRLQRYTQGESVSFADVPCKFYGTDFQKQVLAVTQSLPYGTTITYGQLAELAGSPGAARAVGTAMAQNQIPLIIPCHRVVASGGKLGGYSAAQGVSLKKRLLDMEAAATTRKG